MFTLVFQMSPGLMKCQICQGFCIKKGVRNGIQKYQCKGCKKYGQSKYVYSKCTPEKEQMIVQLNGESCGVSSIARVTGLSKASIVRKIRVLSLDLEFKMSKEYNQVYEVDELKTFVGNKQNESWLMYSLNRSTNLISFLTVGRRTKLNLSKVVNPLLNLSPKQIFTDRLNIYPKLISEEIHSLKNRGTNRIERMNLNFRHFLKRLSRRTISYSKSEEMLFHCCRLLWHYRFKDLKIG